MLMTGRKYYNNSSPPEIREDKKAKKIEKWMN